MKRKYVVLNAEFLAEMPREWVRKLEWLLETHNGGLVERFDSLTYILVDDKVPEDIKEYIAEMLEGHPITIQELDIVPAPQGGWKPSQGRGTFSTYGRGPSIRKMRQKP